MSSDKTLNTKITFEVDNASLNRASRAYDSLGDDLDNLVKQQEQYEKKQRQIQKNAAESRAFEQQARRGFSSSGGDAPASRNAGGGDLGKLSSGISAISDLSNGIDVNSILGAVDGISDLASGAGGLGGILSSVASVAGITGIALTAVSFAFQKVMEDAEKQARQLESTIDARRDALQFEAGGGTTAEAQKLLEERTQSLEAEKKLLSELENSYAATREQLGLLAPISDIFFPQGDELNAQIAQSKATIDGLESSVKAYNRLLRENALAFNDSEAAAAEASKNEEIEAKKRAVDEAKKLADEERNLADARREAEQATREAERAEEQRANALNDLNNKLVDAAKKNADAEEDIATKLSDSRSDARRQLNRDLQSLNEKERADRIKLVTSTQNEEAKSARAHQRNLEKIQKDAQRQREDLAANLDFAGIFQLDRDTNAQLMDASGDYEAEREERRIALDEQLADLRISAIQSRQERQVAYRNELQDLRIQANRANRDRVTQYNREIELANTAYSRQLKLLADKFTAETKLYQQFADRTSSTGGTPRASSGDIGFPPTQGVIGRGDSSTTTTNANTVSININGAQNPTAVSAEVRNELRRLGLG